MSDWLSALPPWLPALLMITWWTGSWLYRVNEKELEKEKNAKIKVSKCPKCGSQAFYYQPILGEVVATDKKVKFCKNCNVEFLPRVKY